MTEVSKTQLIRLADVFFIGPVMVYAGSRLGRQGDKTLGGVLALLGVATILYNGQNYLNQNRLLEK